MLLQEEPSISVIVVTSRLEQSIAAAAESRARNGMAMGRPRNGGPKRPPLLRIGFELGSNPALIPRRSV